MNTMQRDVRDFHREMGLVIGESPSVRRAELRASLIKEEAEEAIEAIHSGDLLHAIKELSDLVYVALGAAVEFGIDLEPFWDEVHRSNMSKGGGAVSPLGKRMKGPGYSPADLEKVMRQVHTDQLTLPGF